MNAVIPDPCQYTVGLAPDGSATLRGRPRPTVCQGLTLWHCLPWSPPGLCGHSWSSL